MKPVYQKSIKDPLRYSEERELARMGQKTSFREDLKTIIWEPARINQSWKMTRVEGDAIAIRDLTRWEKVKYFWKLSLWREK